MKLFENSYQTLPLPDGSKIKGVFPTGEWFNAMSKYIDWQDKDVLDLGCCSFGYGLRAINLGAKFVTGVDNDPLRIEQAVYLIGEWDYYCEACILEECIEDYQCANDWNTHDIIIFSMVIHWLSEPEKVIKRMWDMTYDKLVFVYRLPEHTEPGYRPSVDELSQLIGQQPIASEKLMDTDTQQIQLVIYEKVQP